MHDPRSQTGAAITTVTGRNGPAMQHAAIVSSAATDNRRSELNLDKIWVQDQEINSQRL